MRRLVASLLITLAFALTPAVAGAGDWVADKFPSNALGREYPLTVYLPDGYKDAPGRFPAVYLLHGAGGKETDWVYKGGARETLDGLIRRALIAPVVVVMPEGGSTWWTDGAVDKAGTALIEELIPFVESKYKVSSERAQRGIAGLSMGGYGSLNLALRHPDKFCAAGMISPAIYDPLPPETSAARKTPQFVRDGQFDAELWKSLNYASALDAYKAKGQPVPMWIVSGDHDFLGIALMSAQLYWRLYQIQQKLVELRVIDGDHEWMVFRDALPDTLLYIDRHCGGRRRG
jgi:enterochelin esterase-like enzyme